MVPAGNKRLPSVNHTKAIHHHHHHHHHHYHDSFENCAPNGKLSNTFLAQRLALFLLLVGDQKVYILFTLHID